MLAPVLDWRHKDHATAKLKRCRRCRAGFTNLVDEAGIPSHKTCAENEITR